MEFWVINFAKRREDASGLLRALGHSGYIYTGSDMFRSVWDRTHCGTDPPCLHGTGSKLERYGSIWDHLHKWTHLVPDSRSDPYRVQQVPCKHKAYPYQFRISSKRIRSHLNAASMSSILYLYHIYYISRKRKM